MHRTERASAISRKNESEMIEFGSNRNMFYLQELDSCNKITKNHTARKAYAEKLVKDGIFWTDSVKPAGRESSRYVLLREDHLLDNPESLLYMLADQLGIILYSNLYLFENWKTVYSNSTNKLKHLTFKHLEECGDCYKLGLDKSLPCLQIFRKYFILFLLIKEISSMKNKRIKAEKDVQGYSEKSLANIWKWCFFVDAFIKFVQSYHTYIVPHDHDLTLAKKLDYMYESLMYYYNFLKYHTLTLKYRISVMSMLRYKLKGEVAKNHKLSSKQITNIIRPIIDENGKPDPKKIANLQDKEKGHVLIEQVKQEEIDDLLKIWNVRA